MSRNYDRLITAVICFGFALIVFWDTIKYPAVQGEGFGQGPAFYPRFLAGGLLILGLCQLGSLFFGSALGTEKNKITSDDTQVRPVLPYIIFGLTLLFIGFLPWSGFLAGGLVLATVSAILIRNRLNSRTMGLSLCVGSAIIFLVWLIFSFAIGIDLPASKFF